MRLSLAISGLASTAMQGQHNAIAVCAANEKHYHVQAQRKSRWQNIVLPGSAVTQQLVIQISCLLFVTFV